MNDILENTAASHDTKRDGSLRTIGHISYALHAMVAVGAVLPGVQASVALLLVAFILDLVKRDDARGTWQESHFRWRIRSVLWAGSDLAEDAVRVVSHGVARAHCGIGRRSFSASQPRTTRYRNQMEITHHAIHPGTNSSSHNGIVTT